MRLRIGRYLPILVCLLVLAAGYPAGRGAEPQGQAALALAIERLPVAARVLHTGAHPDDEDTALLAWLARGRGVRAAYLSATRGEGGQNLLGTEQYEALGLLRTEELLAARRLDGAEQFFTRAYDFGYSREAEEALAKWGHERTLADFVRVIRKFRPDVIISRFAGGPQDGHGQHAAAGILAREAYRAAGDPKRFPEQLEQGLQPWQAKKFYIEINRFGPSANQPLPEGALELELGDYSPVLGRSYVELAMEGRSLHRSQAMGMPQRKGPVKQAFLLTDSVLPGEVKEQRGRERDLLDGVETKLEAGPLAGQIERARAAFRAGNTAELIQALARGVQLARELPEPLRAQKEHDFTEALLLAFGFVADALANRAEIVAGEQFLATVTAWNRAPVPFDVREVELRTPEGWTATAAEWKPGQVEYNRSASRAFTIAVPTGAEPSQPYWLKLPREGDSYQVKDESLIGLPHGPPVMEARVRLATSGVEVTVPIEVQYRTVDAIYGQTDRPIAVVPALAAWTEPDVLVLTPGRKGRVSIRIKNHTRVDQPFQTGGSCEWTAQPAATGIGGGGASASMGCGAVAPPLADLSRSEEISATPPGDSSSYSQRFFIRHNNRTALGHRLISYPHIRPRYIFTPAETRIVPVDVKVPPGLRVGYVAGAGDEVPQALRQLGVQVDLLAGAELQSGDLSHYNAIVTGVRAYAVRPDLVAANKRLLEYVEQGGVMIVQYNSDWPGHNRQGEFPYGPYPMRQGGRAPRVSQEEQPVEILAAGDPLFTTPNKITGEDFRNWVQERGLYFMSEWDPRYTPLLSSQDRGQAPEKGGMLAARMGKGLYIYTGYSWFRQLPAGVPGAYRIWANLLSARRKL